MLVGLFKLPPRLLFGTTKLSAKAGYLAGKHSVRTTYRATRWVGLTRLAAFGIGIGLGLLLAPSSGAELRERLRRQWESMGTPDSDDEIADRVRHELAQSPRTWHLPQPEVEVVAGRVILTGEAPHNSGKDDIERAAAAVDGVVDVDSRLMVGS